MKKTFNFGKIDYMGRGWKDCAVDVTIWLEEKGGEKVLDKDGNFTGDYCNKYIEFTASGNIWNHCHSNIYSGGQNLDEIAKYIKTPLFQKIHTLWEKYHLNGLHAGTPEQEEAIAAWKAEGNKYDYNKACEMLKNCGLYEVPLNANLIGTRKADGEPYRYGHGWVISNIPEKDLEEIKKLFAE